MIDRLSHHSRLRREPRPQPSRGADPGGRSATTCSLVALLLVLVGCGSPPTPSRAPTTSAESQSVAAPASALAPSSAAATAATTLPAPAIVQVENSQDGRPQSGLDTASLVYEYVAEGGVGRFSLLYFGSPPPQQLIGPIRSARTVTVALARIYHAFVAYSGASHYITGLLRQSVYPSYDEDTSQAELFRIPTRFPPHNLYTDGRDLAGLASRAAIPPVTYQLWARTVAPPAGRPIHRFTAQVSFAERPLFEWRPDLGGFSRREDTGLVANPLTHTPLVVPTVIIQQVSVTTDYRVVDVAGHYGVDQAILGSGPAQVFCGGQEYPAMWTQPPDGPPQFTLADGSPAPIAPGEVWIALVPTGQAAVAT